MECPTTGLLKSLQAQGTHLLFSPELVTKQPMGGGTLELFVKGREWNLKPDNNPQPAHQQPGICRAPAMAQTVGQPSRISFLILAFGPHLN